MYRLQQHLILVLIVLVCFVSYATGTTCSSNCGVRGFLTDLKAERDKLVVSSTKLAKGIAILNSTTTSNGTYAIMPTRVKQLANLNSAINSLQLEIDIIETRCATTVGDNCDACASGYANFPTCNVPTCGGVAATSPNVCSGRGACLSPDVCNCTSSNGSYCQCPALSHKYQFTNNNGQDAYGLDLGFYNGAGITYSSTDVPNGVNKSISLPAGSGMYSSSTLIWSKSIHDILAEKDIICNWNDIFSGYCWSLS